MKTNIRSIPTGSLLKLGCLGIGTVWICFGLFFGILALFGIVPSTLNGQPVYGITGFLVAAVLGLLFAGLGSLAFLVGALIARLLPGVRDWPLEIRETAEHGADKEADRL